MTRINSNISPKWLIDQHLLAEYHEITRLTKIDFTKQHQITETFRLGKGHVKFFYDKQKFLHKRYLAIREELLDRGFDLKTDYSNRWEEIKNNYPEFYNDYIFNKEECELSMIRILRSLLKMYSKGQKIKLRKNEIDFESALVRIRINTQTKFDLIRTYVIKNYKDFEDDKSLDKFLHFDKQLQGCEFWKTIEIEYIRRQFI